MKQNHRILIVDDEEDILLSFKLHLSQHFEHVDTLSEPTQMLRQLRKKEYDVLLLDMNFKKGETSGEEGLFWLKKVLSLHPDMNVIMITAYADVQTAVEAVKIGAIDFIEKPWRNEKLMATLLATLKLKQSKQQLKNLETKQKSLNTSQNEETENMVGTAPAMQQVYTLIEKVARTDANVLILGENGTGKELVARAIHKQSKRAAAAFVKVDLGALSESLFESELFGHKKGAFTDAKEDRMGRFEMASGGTLFLDEIGNVPMSLQAKLLSALQNRSVQRVGDNRIVSVDIRLVCATNMSLPTMIEEKTFRQDLLYRINTIEIELPALRERATDIPLLVHHFLKAYSKKYQKPNLSIASATLEQLQKYTWRGNVRELRHAVERAVILSDDDVLTIRDFILQSEEKAINDAVGLEDYHLETLESWAIRKVLTKHNGNISRAAGELGLTRATLYRRMEKYGL